MMNRMQSRPAMVPEALQALIVLKQEASPVTPQGMPTVAAQEAEKAAGVMQGMGGMPQSPMMSQAPGISMAAQRSAQAQQPVTQAQLAQLMQSQGVAGLPAQNMRQFREGGIIGFNGEERSDVPESELSVSERLKRGLRRLYEKIETGYMQRAGATPEQIAQKLGAAAPIPQPSTAVPDYTQDLGTPMPTPAKAAPAPRTPAPRPPAPRPPAAPPAAAAQPATGIAQLPARVGVDTGAVELAGNESIIRATDRENRLRDIAEQKERAMAGMPDLNQAGIAALQEARNRQRALFEEEQKDAARQRTLGVLAGVTGRDRGAYDRVVSQQMAARKAEVNADLLTQQAILKLQEAQQAKALGKFDRAQALELEADKLMDAAEKNKLSAQRLAMDAATTQATIGSQQRGQDIGAATAAADRASREQEAAANRATQVQIARIQAAARDNPGGKEAALVARVQTAINGSPMLKSLAEKAKFDPTAAAQYAAEEARLYQQLAPELLQNRPAPGPSATLKYNPATGKIE